MSLLVVGLNHRTAPTSVLERATVGPDDAEKLLHDLLQGEHVAEAVLVAVQRLYLPADLDPPTGVMRLPDFV